MHSYLFDGTMEGLLSAVFEWFERKPGKVILKNQSLHQPDAFEQITTIISDEQNATRVWNGLKKRLEKGWIRRITCAFLSEKPEIHAHLFDLICYLFQHPPGAEMNYGNTHVLEVAQMAKKVEREKHRMEAFIRFQHAADGVFYCGIDPDFNVLPLISNHFRNRYQDQQWIIYDLNRHYGLFYNLETLEQITMKMEEEQNLTKTKKEVLSEKENLYALLWKDYFKSTNIPARKNTKLHIQHVPKRYWKYLTEKQLE
jgi:probable DNA metabolism protein